MKLKVIEPLKMLFKDEVRRVGKELKISDNILKRHPFPGPGLAIRILGDINEEKVKILQDADEIFITELILIIFMIKFGKLVLFYFQLNLLGLWVMKEHMKNVLF